MTHKECEHRMPCGWCDVHNEFCDEVNKKQKEKSKQEESKSDIKCEHNWVYIGQNRSGKNYICFRCNELKTISHQM